MATLDQRVFAQILQLETANKDLDGFSYSVCYDLRAPLRAIRGFSKILLDDFFQDLPFAGQRYLQGVYDNTLKMQRLVEGLLVFSSLGGQEVIKQAVDSNMIVRECLSRLPYKQEGRHVDIVIGDMPYCEAEPTALKEVWTNLISNALKYTGKREHAHIEIGCRIQSRPTFKGQPAPPEDARTEVVYFVKDDGAGFDMKLVPKLFGVFQRLHRESEYEGIGVGLAIAQRIVQRHGGRIWAEASPNEGATFSFTLN